MSQQQQEQLLIKCRRHKRQYRKLILRKETFVLRRTCTSCNQCLHVSLSCIADAFTCAQASQAASAPAMPLEWDWRYPIAQYVEPQEPPPPQRQSLRRSRNSVLPIIGAFGAQPPVPTGDVATSSGERASSKDVGCQVLVRLWRYKQSGKPALETLMLAIQNAVLCSDMGLSISPCGKMLALCASSEVDFH